MRAVAVPAKRRIGIALRGQNPVRTLAVLANDLFMADGAIHLVFDREASAHVGRCSARVALHASNAGVPRSRQLGCIDVQ